MRLSLSIILLSATSVNAFSFCSPPTVQTWGKSVAPLRSTVEAATDESALEADDAAPADVAAADSSKIVSAYESAIAKMRAKDQTSTSLSKEDLKVVYEDEHIVVVDKPSGVLCVPTKEVSASLSQAVFDAYGCESGKVDNMVVHRLGMDTSGLVVFARTKAALSVLNTAFRTRKVVRKYEALVCGSVEADSGEWDMPLMRDYENPPYMRVSNDDLQRALIGLEDLPDEISKMILAQPKESITKYEVIAREELGGHPVTRLSLTSVTGRTHQLNVHTAAAGHPIVADSVYGLNGDAAANGGLSEGASLELQENIAAAAGDKSMCVHAKELSFVHPITGEELNFESSSPF